MRRAAHAAGGVLALATILTGAVGAWAASFTVVPTRVVLDGRGGAGSLKVRNEGDEPVLLQLETLRWQRAVPQIETEPTDALLAVPPVFRLAPGAEQTVRVGLRTPDPGIPETTYRLLLSEVPVEDEARTNGVRFALRFSIPVFVRADGAAPRLDWRLFRDDAGWRLAVTNVGGAHERIVAVRVRTSRGVTHSPEGDVGYLLAGETREWILPAETLRPGEPVRVEIETPGGEQTFEPVVAGS